MNFNYWAPMLWPAYLSEGPAHHMKTQQRQIYKQFFSFFFLKEGLISVLCTGMNVWPHVTASWGGVKVVEAQSYLTLCDLLDCSPPGSSVHGILQARILEQVASPFSGDLPNLGMEP